MAQVLLLEDDPELRMVFREFLLGADHSVYSVGTCEEALTALRNNTPDILVLDVMIAAGTSLDVAKAAADLTPSAPVIFMTGSKDFCLTTARGMNDNVQSVLRKPVLMKNLQDAVALAVQPGSI